MKLDRISPLSDQAIHYKCQNAKMQKRYRPWQSVAADNAVWHKWQVEIDGVLPVMKDSNLAVEYFTDGLSSPTKMAFLDDDNILVLEKSGAVKIVRDGVLQTQPVLQVGHGLCRKELAHPTRITAANTPGETRVCCNIICVYNRL
jgi:predicted transcriptional regulator